MPVDVTLFDQSLVAISWIATCTFVLATLVHRRRHPDGPTAAINLYLAAILFAAFCAFGWATGTSLAGVPALLWSRLWDGTYQRLCLLLFWLLCTAESLLFSMLINCWLHRANTVHRKFFHLTVSLIAISGLCHDPKFLALAAHLTLQIFVIVEVLRSQRVQPWAKSLDGWLLIFVDGQDSPELILTPTFLLAGVFLPVYLDFHLHSAGWELKQRHFAGVLSVGVGDSLAAIVGSRYGRIGWPSWRRNKSGIRRKSMEGSLAMFFGQIVAAELLFGFCSLSPALVLASALSTLVEAHLHVCDNLAIPACSTLVFAMLE